MLLMLDMADALRPSELFAFRWKSFDDLNTLSDHRNDLPEEDSSLRQDPRELDEGSSTGWTCRRAQAVEAGVPRLLSGRPDVPKRGRWILDPANFRYRVLKPLREALKLPKVNFQVLSRTIATRAQKLRSVKDVQSHLRHSRADTTANEYMQEHPESVQDMVGTVYAMLTSAATNQQAG
jgi:integrase